MKTTLNIDDTVMLKLKREAARSGKTMSELVETALRQLFTGSASQAELPPLPVLDMGHWPIDISNRDDLYRFLEEGDPKYQHLYGWRREESK